MMRQRDYLRSKASNAGSKYLRQAFQHICNKVDFSLRKLKSEVKKIEDNPTILEICGKS